MGERVSVTQTVTSTVRGHWFWRQQWADMQTTYNRLLDQHRNVKEELADALARLAAAETELATVLATNQGGSRDRLVSVSWHEGDDQ